MGCDCGGDRATTGDRLATSDHLIPVEHFNAATAYDGNGDNNKVTDGTGQDYVATLANGDGGENGDSGGSRSGSITGNEG